MVSRQCTFFSIGFITDIRSAYRRGGFGPGTAALSEGSIRLVLATLPITRQSRADRDGPLTGATERQIITLEQEKHTRNKILKIRSISRSIKF